MITERKIVREEKEVKRVIDRIIETYVQNCPIAFKKNKGVLMIDLTMERGIDVKTEDKIETGYYIDAFEFEHLELWSYPEEESEFMEDASDLFYDEDETFTAFDYLPSYTVMASAIGKPEGAEEQYKYTVYIDWDYRTYELKKLFKKKNEELEVQLSVKPEQQIILTVNDEEKQAIFSLDEKNWTVSVIETQFDQQQNKKILNTIKQWMKKRQLEKTF